jgi:hypothetical protein
VALGIHGSVVPPGLRLGWQLVLGNGALRCRRVGGIGVNMESELFGPGGGRMKQNQGQTRALGSWIPLKKISGLGILNRGTYLRYL